jgi:hypothetical protein
MAAILVALVLAPTAETASPASAAPGRSNLLEAQWPSLEHALRAGPAPLGRLPAGGVAGLACLTLSIETFVP